MGAAALALVVNGARLNGEGMPGDMYADPEYADTWRWTRDPRYVEEEQWMKDGPSGYKDHIYVQNGEQENVPDYWSHDYSGLKHWGYAADPFYSNPDVWVESSPKDYDDYVNIQSQAQNVYNMGVTFMPKAEPVAKPDLGLNLVQSHSK